MEEMQDMLGAGIAATDINVDIIFVIDASGSMVPFMQKVKDLTLSFYKKLEEGLKRSRRKIENLRVKVIAFRDYYDNSGNAMEESEFFILPEEEKNFRDCIDKIRAEGGGDEPENGLEALFLAMHSPFVKEGNKRRHIVVLFSDASAHSPWMPPHSERVPQNYPADMYQDVNGLFQEWSSRDDKECLRMVMFTPSVYPYNEMEKNLENVIRKDIKEGQGGEDLDNEEVVRFICCSMR